MKKTENTKRIDKRNLRKLTAFMAALMLVLLLVPQRTVKAEKGDYGPDICGATYCVIDGNTGDVVISQNKDVPLYPASTTKVMTALIVLEEVEDLNQMLTFTESAINIDPSSSTLDPKAAVGEQMKVVDALYGMLLKSANECGAMLGEFVAGSEAAFAEKMNKKAEELGCTHTHFMNAYGIHHEEHYTSAYDLCLILKAAMENPRFREIMQNVRYTIPETNLMPARALENGHAMLNGSYPEEGILGGKTGSTPEAGRVLVTAAEQEGHYTISALMKSNTDNFYNDESVLLEYTRLVYQGWGTKYLTLRERNDTVTPGETVRVRYSPSMHGGVLGKVDAGTQLHRKGAINDWSVVDFEGKTGYIYSELLDFPGKETDAADMPTDMDEPTTEETTQASSDESTDASSNTDTPSENSSDAGKENEENVTSAGKSETERTTEKEGNREKKSGGFVRFIMDHLDQLLITLAVLIAIVFTALWVMVLKDHLDKKKRLEKRYQQARDNAHSFLEEPVKEEASEETSPEVPVKEEPVKDEPAAEQPVKEVVLTRAQVPEETAVTEAAPEEPVQAALENTIEDELKEVEIPVVETEQKVETDEKNVVTETVVQDLNMDDFFDAIDEELRRNDT